MAAVIHDIRHLTPNTNGTRPESSITHIARHHSGGSSGDWSSFWPYWNKSKGWGTGGYHEIILRDGSVQLCYDPKEITNGVGGHNSYIYNICIVGNGSFTDEQERTWEERSLLKLKQLGISVDKVLGHREFKGTNTACPGIDMGMVRNRLRYLQGKSPSTIKEETEVNYLKRGDTGPAVKIMQQKLVTAGIKLDVDSSFGPATERAVKLFQKINGLAQDGSYGPATQRKLDDVIKPKPKAKSVDQLAQEVIDGKHGSGDAREKSLGSQYDAVQKKVNELLGAKEIPKPTPAPTVKPKPAPAKEPEAVILIAIKLGKVTELTGKTIAETLANVTKFLK